MLVPQVVLHSSHRLKMFACLAPDTLGQLTLLLAVLYSTNMEKQFLYHSTTYLLLELTSRSPDFSRNISTHHSLSASLMYFPIHVDYESVATTFTGYTCI